MNVQQLEAEVCRALEAWKRAHGQYPERLEVAPDLAAAVLRHVGEPEEQIAAKLRWNPVFPIWPKGMGPFSGQPFPVWGWMSEALSPGAWQLR